VRVDSRWISACRLASTAGFRIIGGAAVDIGPRLRWIAADCLRQIGDGKIGQLLVVMGGTAIGEVEKVRGVEADRKGEVRNRSAGLPFIQIDRSAVSVCIGVAGLQPNSLAVAGYGTVEIANCGICDTARIGEDRILRFVLDGFGQNLDRQVLLFKSRICEGAVVVVLRVLWLKPDGFSKIGEACVIEPLRGVNIEVVPVVWTAFPLR
jgi:hypothetical protein